MLEAMRRNSRGTIIYVLFGILIAVFIINFGPGSRGCSGAIANSFAARVSRTEISDNEFRLYYIAKVGNRFDSRIARQYRMKEILMDKVIERELLAQQAESLGFRVSTKEAEDLVKTGKMLLLGRAEPWGDVSDGFDYKKFHAVIENTLGVSVQKFLEIQQREMLAERMRQLMAGSIKVAPAEAQQAYDDRERQANLQFVRFSPSQYEQDVDVSPEEIAAYQKAHGDELKKMYEERAFLYRHLDKQARVRRILVAVDKDEKDADVVAKAQKKADKAKSKVTGDGAKDFAEVAKTVSDDDLTKAKGGDLGWHKKGYFGLGDEIEGKIFAAKEGDVIGPVRSDKGFELIKVEGFREGDVPFEKVAGELAEQKLRSDAAKAAAKKAADDAVAKVREENGTLDKLYPKKEGGDETDAEKIKQSGPVAEETGTFPRRGDMVPQIGLSKEIMTKAFEMKQGEVAGPFEVSGTYVVVQAKERREPDEKWFAEHKDEEMRALERQKWADVIDAWSHQKCTEVNADGRIRVSPEAVSYENAGDTNYVPCSASTGR